jgi:hypothetical protein
MISNILSVLLLIGMSYPLWALEPADDSHARGREERSPRLSLPGPTYTHRSGALDVVNMDRRACVFQKDDSPSEGESLKDLPTNRVAKHLKGPAELLAACLKMKELHWKKCSKVFLGGHGWWPGIGVGGLFQVNATVGEKELAAYRTEALVGQLRSASLRPIGPGADSAERQNLAKKALEDGKPCALGPLSPAFPATHFQKILSCLADLVDPHDDARAVVMASCGPRDNATYSTGQFACAKQLAEALGTPVIYSTHCVWSENGSGDYSVTDGRQIPVSPGYWR